MSSTSCRLYIHLHPLAKTCLHPTADRLSAIQSPVKSRWIRSTPWKHLHLISLHKTGVLLMLDFPEVRYNNSWFTTAAQASLRKPFFFFSPLWDYSVMFRLNPTHMSPGASTVPRLPRWHLPEGDFLFSSWEDILVITKARAIYGPFSWILGTRNKWNQIRKSSTCWQSVNHSRPWSGRLRAPKCTVVD